MRRYAWFDVANSKYVTKLVSLVSERMFFVFFLPSSIRSSHKLDFDTIRHYRLCFHATAVRISLVARKEVSKHVA